MFYQICFQLIEKASTNIFILIFTFVLIPRIKTFEYINNLSTFFIFLIYLHFFHLYIFLLFLLQRSRKIIAKCEQIDNILQSFGIEKNYRKIFFQLIQFLITFSIIMISIILLNIYWYIYTFNFGFDLILLTYIPILTMTLGIFTFIIFIR